MLRAAQLDEFVTAPAGRCYLGARFLLWALDATTCGTVAWGRITEADGDAIVRAWSFESQMAPHYASVVDLAALEGVEPGAFEVIARFMITQLPVLATRIKRQALVRPPGMQGATVAGFYPTLAPAFEWRDFASRTEAFAWCWPESHALENEISALVQAAQSATPRLAQLRHYLAENLQTPSLSDAARVLACAERSLQRELADAGTGFRAEVQKARLTAAEALLLDSDLKVAVVAKRVGFESMTSFSAMFTKHCGTTPAAFRARHRK